MEISTVASVDQTRQPSKPCGYLEAQAVGLGRFDQGQIALSGAQVRERTGIGESSVSDFENGRREPSLSQLQKLADTYRRSVTFFPDGAPLADEPSVLWRQRPARNAEEIEVNFLRLCDQYRNLEVWCNECSTTRLPAHPSPDRGRYGYPQAEELVKRVLKELQLGDRPGLSLLSTLEEVGGVKVFHIDFEPSGSAASAFSNAFGAAVLLNSKNARWRRNYDLAHELFHLLTLAIFHPVPEPQMVATDEEEKLATCFARNLLLPADPFCTAINSRMRENRIPFDSVFQENLTCLLRPFCGACTSCGGVLVTQSGRSRKSRKLSVLGPSTLSDRMIPRPGDCRRVTTHLR